MGWWFGVSSGMQMGIDKYHQMCYDIGGWVIDSEGHVVECHPNGQLPVNELQKVLDKK